MKDENRSWENSSWHEPSTFPIPFEFQYEIGQLEANHAYFNKCIPASNRKQITWFRLNINCIGWWSESKMCVDQITLTFSAPSALEAPYEKLVPSFSLDRGPKWGRNPKSKSVKWTTLRGQFVVQKWFNAPIIPYPSPGPKGWEFQLTGALDLKPSPQGRHRNAIMFKTTLAS